LPWGLRVFEQHEIEWRAPIDAFAPLASAAGAVLLHAGARTSEPGWSFITAFPQRVVERKDGETWVDGERDPRCPFTALQDVHRSRRLLGDIAASPPLASGLVGFAGYECGALVEPSVTAPRSPYRLPDLFFGSYDACIAFDARSRQAFAFGRSRLAVDRLEASLGRRPAAVASFEAAFNGGVALTSADDYRRAVAGTIERIRDGELFQTNLSQRFFARAIKEYSSFDLFAAALNTSSAPYAAYLQCGAAQILSLSPERFFAVKPEGGDKFSIVAEPIKGTRPRGLTAEEDERLLAELICDPKDRAENIMIADLMRNDLSRICANHSIREEAICEPVSHAGVHHLVSRISGGLRRDVTAVDALKTLFPCGSITGAPKVQAMKVIAEVEGVGRGPYCGAIGYIDDRGGADFSVAIRIAIAEAGGMTIPVGGGVTLRSDPQAEYEETLTKARSWLAAIGGERRRVA